MRIIIAGATGFIGRNLSRFLLEKNYEVVALVRNLERARAILGPRVMCLPWQRHNSPDWQEMVSGSNVIINLVGENIAGKPWTPKVRQSLLTSRLDSVQAICTAIQKAPQKPALLIQASAIGFYGNRGDEIIDESASAGHGYLADLVQKWEAASLQIAALGLRRIVLRTGVVLDHGGGMVAKLYWPYRLFLGAIPGTGRQWLSWITMPDLVRAIEFFIQSSNLAGIFNLCAPEPVTMAQFCRAFARALQRPVWLRISPLVLFVILGQMARETLLTSQRIVPKRLLESGFVFQYPNVETIGKIL